MFEIEVNGKVVQLLQPITTVKSLNIRHVQGIPIKVPATHTKAIAEWLYDLTQQVDTLMYNNIIMDKDSINKPSYTN